MFFWDYCDILEFFSDCLQNLRFFGYFGFVVHLDFFVYFGFGLCLGLVLGLYLGLWLRLCLGLGFGPFLTLPSRKYDDSALVPVGAAALLWI